MEYDDGDDGGSGDDASFMKGFLSLSHTHQPMQWQRRYIWVFWVGRQRGMACVPAFL